MRSSPKIDQRKFANIWQEIRQLMPFYTPEWQVAEDNESGSALLKIFAYMVAGTVEQLNQVPEKNFIAFLNLLGVKLLPAKPARVPVSFSLSQGATKTVLIPKNTKVSAESVARSPNQDRLIFETEKSILVTTAKLVAAYSVNPNRDRIFAAPPGFSGKKPAPVVTRSIADARVNDTSLLLEDVAGIKVGDILKIGNFSNYEYLEVEQVSDRQITFLDMLTADYPAKTTIVEKIVNFELFTGKNSQEHSLYLGDLTLFNLSGNARLTLDIQPENSLTKLADPSLVSWQYWGEDPETQTLKWYSFDNVAIESDQLILEKNNNYELQTTEINGIKSHRWIRCTIVSQSSEGNSPLINDLQDLQINEIKVTVNPSAETETTASPPDYCLTFNNWQYENKTEESKTGIAFQPFRVLEDEHQAIYLGFDTPPLKGPISLFFSLGIEVDGENNRPRLSWSYYRRHKEKRAWTRLNIRDQTNSLTKSGTVEFIIGSSDFAPVSRFGKSLYWLRIVDVEDRFSSQLDTPTIEGIYLNTTWASQTETIEREIVGSSNGKANQTFTLFRSPILSAEMWVNELTALTVEDRQKLLTLAEQNKLQIEEVRDDQGNYTQFWVKWESREDLLESKANDRHYEIDRTLGQIKFGNGTEGAIPPMGVNNIRVTYQVGGGKQGNIDRGQINRLNSSIAYIDRVNNPEPAEGGNDRELLERALERGPQILKHRHRAVTAEDFERLSERADRSVIRVKCLPNINKEGKSKLGWVSVIVVPDSSEAQPQPTLRLKQQVEKHLRQHAANLVTTPKHIYVRNPVYVEIAIKTSIVAIALEAMPEVELMARSKLRAFLHPLTGGYKNRGWAFGRSPCLSDFYALLGSIPGVDRVEFLSIVSADGKEIQVPPYALVSSGKHQIDVILT